MFTLSIPRVPPSNNILLRLHWAKRKALIDEWHGDIYWLVLEAGRQKFDVAKVEAVLYFAEKRRRDLANFCASIDKLCLDALVYAGVLADDDSEHLPELTVRFGIDAKNPRTVLSISEIV
jgi:hypothetical protein